MIIAIRIFLSIFVLLLGFMFPLNHADAQWWKNDKIKADLKLTEKQVSDISKIFDESRKNREARIPQIRKKMGELDEMMKGEALDEKKAKVTVDELTALQAENFREFITMKMKIRKLLSKEQFRTLNEKYPNILTPSSRWAARDRMSRRGQGRAVKEGDK